MLVVDGQQLVQEVTPVKMLFPSLCDDLLLNIACLPQACQRHKTSPTASAALGRALLGTLLLATFRGEAETTQVTFQGNGPLGQIQVRICHECILAEADLRDH